LTRPVPLRSGITRLRGNGTEGNDTLREMMGTNRDDSGAPLSLDATEITSAVVRAGSVWREVRVVTETGSTNADLLAVAREGAREGVVLVAEAQTAGRGRMGRRWTSPPRAGLTFSVLLRPYGVPAALLGWVPLLTGAAVAAAVKAVAAVDTSLKWPNDVLARGAKLGGILAERSGSAVVAGIGVNVYQRQAELPGDGATSLLLETSAISAAAAEAEGVVTGPDLRARALVAVLTALSDRYLAWRDQFSPGDAEASGLRQEYLGLCATLGREVTVTLPGGKGVTGTAEGVDWAGRLEVRTASATVPVSAGDVAHLR
jgi:BirA family transcriptional regulator, biotin operon repressor / biotin---[acetyl-CoA-carboxylase] ligase